MKRIALLLVLAVMALAAGCGDELSINENPAISISLDERSVDPDGSSRFGFEAVLQLATEKTVTVTNTGNGDLTVSEIGWLQDPDTGLFAKNEHLSLVGLPAEFPTTLPSTGTSSLNFKIVLTPPASGPLTDYSESVLVIRSNARDATGKSTVPEIRLTLTVADQRAVPTITPSGTFVFRNATSTRPETQPFSVGHDPERSSAAFQVMAVRLSSASDEFTLHDLPNQGTVVAEPNDPSSKPVTFNVTYTPLDDGHDTIDLLVDVSTGGTLKVTLQSGTVFGSYELSYDHDDSFDFTNVNTVQTRRVNILSTGPGPMTVKREPEILEAEARQVFTWKAFKPPTKPGEVETEVAQPWASDIGLANGRSVDIEVTYDPGGTPDASPNGTLRIPIATPNNGEILVELLAGTPKPILAVAPSNHLIVVNDDRLAGNTGQRHVALYNYGNGPQEVVSATVSPGFGKQSSVFSLVDSSDGISIPPHSVRMVEVAWDPAGLQEGTTETSEVLEVRYTHGFTGEEERETFTLDYVDIGSELVLPTVDPGDTADYTAVAGTPLTLSAADSTPGDYSFPVGSTGFLWYVIAQPAGSKVRFAEESGTSITFTPDVAGSYQIEVYAYAEKSGADPAFVYSAPAVLTLDVAAAP